MFSTRIPLAPVFLAYALALAAAAPAGAEVYAFRLTLDGDARVATVPQRTHEGAPYVSLRSLVQQLGGACEVVHGRAQVDFLGKSAWIAIGDRAVDASLSRFFLNHPVVRDNTDVLMALSDVSLFFAQAFRAALERETLSGTAAPAEEKEVPVVAEELPVPGSAPAHSAPSMFAEPPPYHPIETVILDAGHGGAETGCVGSAGFAEKDLTLSLVRRLKQRLGASTRLRVLLTRDEDVALAANQRADLANIQRGDVLISIHGGASYSPTAHGVEVFWTSGGTRPSNLGARGMAAQKDYGPESQAVAAVVAESLAQETGAPLRGVREAPCLLLKKVTMPGLLIEVGCMTTAAEESLLQTDAYQEKIADGIAAGLSRYMAAGESGQAAP